MKTKPIYLDYMAKTPVDPTVVEQMLLYLGPEGCFASPSRRQYPEFCLRASVPEVRA